MRPAVPEEGLVRLQSDLKPMRVLEDQDEPLHGLEALSLDPEPAVRPCQEKSLPLGLGPRRESMRTSGEEEGRPRALDRPKQPAEVLPLIRREVRFDIAIDIVIDPESTRLPPVERAR